MSGAPRKASFKPSPNQRLFDIIVKLGLIALVLVLVYNIFAPLFPAILWGTLLAIICAHPYERLAGRLRGRRGLADAAFGVILVLVLLIPALFFAWELILNFPSISERIADLAKGPLPPVPEWLAGLPVIGGEIRRIWGGAVDDVGTRVPEMLANFGNTASWLLAQIGTFGTFLFQFVLGAIISLFLLHYRFEVRAFLNRVLSRVGGQFANALVLAAFETTRATFAGVIAAAIAQTLLAGIGLFAAGLPALVLFAGFTFLLALMQIGPLLVLLVADTILIAREAYVAATLLSLWFVVVVMSVDNLIRPYFSSRGTDMPGILSFLGAVGGFLTWGLIGVFVGPVLTAILYDMLIAWVEVDETPTADEEPSVSKDN